MKWNSTSVGGDLQPPPSCYLGKARGDEESRFSLPLVTFLLQKEMQAKFAGDPKALAVFAVIIDRLKELCEAVTGKRFATDEELDRIKVKREARASMAEGAR